MRFLRLGPSGIRGAVGSALTAQLAIKYASAFGTWLDGGTVGVAIDTRTSSPMFKSACFAGLLATGCNVVDFGIRPAPVLHFAVKNWDWTEPCSLAEDTIRAAGTQSCRSPSAAPASLRSSRRKCSTSTTRSLPLRRLEPHGENHRCTAADRA